MPNKFSNNVQTNITFNGKKVDSLDDLPASVREKLQDEDGNGIPDFADELIKNGQDTAQNVTVETKSTPLFDSETDTHGHLKQPPSPFQPAPPRFELQRVLLILVILAIILVVVLTL